MDSKNNDGVDYDYWVDQTDAGGRGSHPLALLSACSAITSSILFRRPTARVSLRHPRKIRRRYD
jgi:hypothetical protein